MERLDESVIFGMDEIKRMGIKIENLLNQSTEVNDQIYQGGSIIRVTSILSKEEQQDRCEYEDMKKNAIGNAEKVRIRNEVENMIEKYDELWTNRRRILKTDIKHSIELTSGTGLFNCPYYMRTETDNRLIDAEIKTLMHKGII